MQCRTQLHGVQRRQTHRSLESLITFYFIRGYRHSGAPLPDSPLSSYPSENTPVAGVDFSSNNVQVSGVYERDIVKMDSMHIFALSSNIFSYLRVNRDRSGGKLIANFAIPTYTRDMLSDPK